MKLYGHLTLHSSRLLSAALVVALAMAAAVMLPGSAFAGEQVIYNFTGGSVGTVSNPPIADQSGNLYGTTFDGGVDGAGTVYELSPPPEAGGAWTETILYSFSYAQLDGGIGPKAGVVMDAAGNLYGTAWLGGPVGGGVVFELSPPAAKGEAWTYSLLYGFGGENTNLDSPEAPLAIDKAGNLYGTTSVGGTGDCIGGCGGVFKLTRPGQTNAAWTETVLHNFPGTPNSGGGGVGGLTMDANGALYGSAITPAKKNGLVYRLTPPTTKRGKYWAYHVVYTFAGGSDGSVSSAPLVFDKNGNLYGATSYGGTATCFGGYPCGTVFRLSPNAAVPWKHTVLYSFNGGTDGGYLTPATGLAIDAVGNLYGSTSAGGGSGCDLGDGCGTVFQLAAPVAQGGSWTESILYRFSGGADGSIPGSVTLGAGGSIYGPAISPTNYETLIFSVTP